MEKEFNLSNTEEYPKTFGYKYEDVKEFIKLLKEEINLGNTFENNDDINWLSSELFKIIDKLAGDKLNGKPIDLSGRS